MIGDNSALFDWTYVDNVAYAHILAARQVGVREGVAGEVRACRIDNGPI